MIDRLKLRSLLMMGLLLLFGAAMAQDCERGDLDARYCDEDGDMLADTPTDPADLLDPSTLVFTYAPTEDPAVYQNAFGEFLDHVTEITGRDVVYFPVESYAAQIEAMRAGRLHISGFAAGAVNDAVKSAGFIPAAMMADENGESGYKMQIIVHPDSDIAGLDDLEGRQLAMVSPTSSSGYKAPAALLYDELGVKPDEGYETAFSGGHDNSVLGVVNGDYEAAAIASSVMERMIDRDVLAADDVKIIYESQVFPRTAYGYVYNLDPDLAAQVEEAFLTFEWEGTALKEEFSDNDQFISVDYKRDWEVMRTIDEAAEALED